MRADFDERNKTMEKTGFRKNLINIEPYVAGEQPKSENIIKLNANENAYPPSPLVQKAISGFDASVLRKYPDFSGEPLKSKLALYYGLKPSQVFVGNGSDDVLAAAFRAFFNSDKPILYPDVTYSFYPVWCDIMRIPYKTIPLKEDLTIDVNDYNTENGGIIFPNPNAPTSIALDKDKIITLLDNNRDVVVVIDETYIDFGGESCIDLLDKYDNLVLTRTFSKSRSLAGMRLGFAMASEELISYMNAVKDSYNSYPVDAVAIKAGCAAVEDDKYFKDTLNKLVSTRERLADALSDMGFDVADSSANFLFAKHDKYAAKEVFAFLREKGIFVRYFNKPRIDDRLRITVGTDEETDALINALKELIK